MIICLNTTGTSFICLEENKNKINSVSLEYSQINYYTIVLIWRAICQSSVIFISFIFTWTIMFVTSLRLCDFYHTVSSTIRRGWVGAGSGPFPGPSSAVSWTHWPGSPVAPSTVNWSIIIITLTFHWLSVNQNVKFTSNCTINPVRDVITNCRIIIADNYWLWYVLPKIHLVSLLLLSPKLRTFHRYYSLPWLYLRIYSLW